MAEVKVIGKRHFCANWLPDASADSVNIIVACVCGVHYYINSSENPKWRPVPMGEGYAHFRRVDDLIGKEYLGEVPLDEN